MSSPWKISVVGAGGLGSLIGGLLAEGGQEVMLVNPRRKEHIDAIQQKGLTIVDEAGERTALCGATTNFDEVGVVDLLILTVKAHQTEQAMKSSLPMIGEDTVALSLQNGIGCEETMGEVIGRERVMGGVTMQGGEYLAPGRVRHVNNLPTEIGELDGRITERIQGIANLFNESGIDTTVSRDVRRAIWRKTLFCVGDNAIATICRFKVGELFDVDVVKEVIFEAIEEAAKVGRAEGISLNSEDISWAKDMVARVDASKRSDSPVSGVQIDILRGRKTDIDFKNGAIVRFGKKNGIPTPINKTLWATIKGLEKNFKD